MQVYINEGLKEKKYRFTKSFSLQNGKDSKDECLSNSDWQRVITVAKSRQTQETITTNRVREPLQQ